MKKLLLVILLFASPVFATTRYVSTTGSDSNSCAASASSSTPKQHFTGGNGALACMSSGDVLIVRGGTYTETIDQGSGANLPSGSSGSPTTIQAFSGETVWLQPTGGNVGFHVVGTISYI